MSAFAYKPNLDSVLDRLRTLYERRGTDRIFASFAVPSPVLAAFQQLHSEGFCDYPDPAERIAFWDGLLAERAALDDDSVPVAYLSEMDQGLYGGLVGGEVQFMVHPENGWISSMVPKLLDSWDDFDRLSFDTDHPWFDRYTRQLDTFVQRAAGKFGVSHFILIDGLNFAFELVGATDTYLSLIERPDMVRRAIELAFDINVAVQETFFGRVPLLAGGTCSNMAQWVPGRIVSESVDPFHMTSLDYFERWGREPIERILGRFDGGVAHIHGNGRHLLETVSRLPGLKALFMGDDRGFPLAFDIVDELRTRSGDLPLVVEAPFEPFVERLRKHQLPGGVFYKVQNAPDADTANRLMEEVRAYH